MTWPIFIATAIGLGMVLRLVVWGLAGTSRLWRELLNRDVL